MAISRRNFVRAAGLGSLGVWGAPLGTAHRSESLLNLFRRHEPPAPGQLLLCYNENPVGPGKAVVDALQNALGTVSRYPFSPVIEFRQALLRHLNLPPEQPTAPGAASPADQKSPLVIGVGSTEILRSCIIAFTGPDRAFVTGSPSFDSPPAYAATRHVPVRAVPLDAHLRLDLGAMLDQVRGAGMVYVCNPNNPTGTYHEATEVSEFIKQVNARAPDCMIVVDEAYLHYTDDLAKVTVQQVAGPHGKAADPDRSANFYDMHVGMGNCNVTRKKMESQGLDFIEIPHGAVRHAAHASHRLMHVGVYLTPERA